MEGSLFQDEANVKHIAGRPDRMKARQPSTTGSCSSLRDQDSNCYYKAVEFACSACLFCVACPLSIICCCIKLPCKVGCSAAERARHWVCCGSRKKIYAYSSFSDIDSDSMPSKVGRCNSSGSSKNRIPCRTK